MHTTIGERLRRFMAERELSAAQLAKMADVKPSFIYDVIHGKSTNPSIIKLAQIAEALDMDIAALIGSSRPSALLRQSEQQQSQHEGGYAVISSIQVEASMGGGSVVENEEKGKPYYFRKDWIRDRLGVSAADLRMIYVRGDSMEPTLCAGDSILVDITKKNPTPPGIFVLFDGLGLVVKRLEVLSNSTPPRLNILSDNPQYAAYERSMDELHIIGRVVWFARQL